MATQFSDAQNAGQAPAFGIMTIDGAPATSVRFRKSQDDGEDRFDVSFHMANRQVTRLKSLAAGELVAALGADNAQAIRDRDTDRGTLNGEALRNVAGVTPSALQRRAEAEVDQLPDFAQAMRSRHPSFVNEFHDARWTVQARGDDGLYTDLATTDDAHEAHQLFLQGSQFRVLDNSIKDYAADYELRQSPQGPVAEAIYHKRSPFGERVLETEPNVVRGPDPERVAQIDTNEALESLLRKRQRERQALSGDIDLEARRVNELDAHAKRIDRGNDLDELAGRTPSFAPLTMTEHEKNQRAELMQQLHAQFRVHGSEYRFKDQPGKIAFRDDGNQLKSATNDDRVARAMAVMAEAKGWKTISVSGHPDFRREVWLEASLRGLEVKGYKPTEQDVSDLATARSKQQKNIIERAPDREIVRGAPERVQEAPEQARGRPAPPADREAPGTPPAALQARSERPSGRVLSGILVAHGEAPYRNKPGQEKSYYATLATNDGQRTVWGKDLQRVISSSGVDRGELITLAVADKKPVTVQAREVDADGKVRGVRPLETNRNSWELTRPGEAERAAIIEAVAKAVTAEKIADPAHREVVLAAIANRVHAPNARLPEVKVYDHTAPVRDAGVDRARPQVERRAERTR